MVVHDQAILQGETQLVATLGVREGLAASVVLPLRVFHTSIEYLGGDGMPVAIENPAVHHRDETLTGIGDVWLTGRARMQLGGFAVGARLGVTLPLGRTEEDPFTLGDMGLRHEHSQFGTGTFLPIVGVEATRAFGGVALDASVLTLQSLYENGRGYQAGDRYGATVGAASSLGTKRWRFRGALEVQAESAERWHGAIHTDEGNTGRIDLLVGAEAMWRFADDWHVAASLRVPAYTHVEGGQLEVSGFVGLSIGTRVRLFEGPARPHAHSHEHGEEHAEGGEHKHGDEHAEGDEHKHGDEHGHAAPVDWTGLDKLEVTKDGSAVPLVPVPGKITVFDFWATWCVPCGELERELQALARRYPDAIAIRKLDIVDSDSAASKKYLADFTIPHIKVFGRDGRLLFVRSAAPAKLAAEVEKAILAK